MRKIATLICLFLSVQAFCQKNTQFNSRLADSLGADVYGMKMYILVLLKPGPDSTIKGALRDSLFVGHMHNIQRLVKGGQMVLAGPFEKNDKHYEGIFILNVKTIVAATALLSTDPSISHKVLVAELFEWYGPAALPMYLNFHDSVRKENF